MSTPSPAAIDAVPTSDSGREPLQVAARFCPPHVDPFSTVEWDRRSATIKDESGQALFEQKNCEVPAKWSQLATNVVVSKYFYGEINTPERETSVRQLIHRVTRTIADWGKSDGLFATEVDAENFYRELTWLCLHQYGAFNSPVWFNVGLWDQYGITGAKCNWRWDPVAQASVQPENPYEYPQGSACFIQSVGDNMEDIMELARAEAMLFKYGSGTGTDLSTLRSHREKLSGGGKPSGPLSFMRVYDQIACVVKSGGKTRRAAKMQSLKVHHPDILEFVEAKSKEEKKARVLIQSGYDANFNGEAYSSILFQNANLSVRVTDEFMRAVEDDRRWTTHWITDPTKEGPSLPARELFGKMAEGAWLCGDPGVQYDTTINRWHTCPNSGRINASNPCVTGETLVSTAEGYRRIVDLVGRDVILVDERGVRRPATRVFKTGHKPVYRLTTASGFEVRLTADHKVKTVNRGDVPACELTRDDRVLLNPVGFGTTELAVETAEIVGLMLGDGSISRTVADGEPITTLTMNPVEERAIVEEVRDRLNRLKSTDSDGRGRRPIGIGGTVTTACRLATGSTAVAELLERFAVLDAGSAGKRLTDEGLTLERPAVAGLLRGLFTADGCVHNYGTKSQSVSLDSCSETLLRQVQLLLLGFGIKGKLYCNRRVGPLVARLPDGRGGHAEYPVQQMHSLRISRSSRVRFEKEIGFWAGSAKQLRLEALNASVATYADPMHDAVRTLVPDGIEDVYDLTEPVTSHFGAGGLVVHNCSEYMFLDDSACNLASINLMKFRNEDGTFDHERFREVVRIYFIAQEILVDHASYPTARIAANSHKFRPLGLGFANLGSLLMAAGLPYDSDSGRGLCGAITSIMHGAANLTSIELAKAIGPFDGYAVNRDPMLNVMRMHREAVEKIDQSCPTYLRHGARKIWEEILVEGPKHGFRNAQSTVLAPTGCLVGNSLVLTDRGLVRIESLGNPNGRRWQPLDVKVATDQGPRAADKFFVNGAEPVVSVETSRGYRIQGTTMHRVKVVGADGTWVWKRFSDIRPGDRVPLMLGGMVGNPQRVQLPPLGDAHWLSDHETFVPREMNADLAEFVGYFMGDGSLHAKGLRLCVVDADVIERLRSLGRKLFGLEAHVSEQEGYREVAFHSVRLVLWWEACGFMKRKPTAEHSGKGYTAHIPDAILHSNDRDVYAAFVRGLFEADGAAMSGYAYWATVNEQFSRDVQTLLLTLGFVTTRKIELATEGRFGNRSVCVLRLLNVATAARFADEIGFMSSRKQDLMRDGDHPQAARKDRIPVTREMVDRLAPENDGLRKTLLMSLSRHEAVSRRSAVELLERTADPELQQLLQFFYDEVETAVLGTEEFTYDISVPDNVTYVAGGFVSHNTISFLMDCDTTGIEPDIALVKYKQLAGGGMMKIVNRTVPMALKTLGYDDETVDAALRYIDLHDRIEGFTGLKAEHVAVFDCAFPPRDGKRSIAWRAHVLMMAAAQPFLSGAISKTVNMPRDAAPEDIGSAYMEGWKLGLKALAVYRDGSKESQPLSTSKDEGSKKTEVRTVEKIVEKVIYRPRRERLPDTRQSVTHKFNVAGHEGYLTVGLYDDGRPGEMFVTMAKEGSTVGGMMDCFGTAVSMSLQYGVPLDVYVRKFSHTRFEPMGPTGNPDIPLAKSIVDYLFRWLGMRFIPGFREANSPAARMEHDDDDSEGDVVGSPVVAVSVPAVSVPAVAAPVATNGNGNGNGHGNGNGNGNGNGADHHPTQTAAYPPLPGAEPAVVVLAQRGTKAPAESSKLSVLNPRAKRKSERLNSRDAQFAQFQSDSPACDVCGAITVRNGNCYLCHECGSSMGCS